MRITIVGGSGEEYLQFGVEIEIEKHFVFYSTLCRLSLVLRISSTWYSWYRYKKTVEEIKELNLTAQPNERMNNILVKRPLNDDFTDGLKYVHFKLHSWMAP